jgi:hypothetical protein
MDMSSLPRCVKFERAEATVPVSNSSNLNQILIGGLQSGAPAFMVDDTAAFAVRPRITVAAQPRVARAPLGRFSGDFQKFRQVKDFWRGSVVSDTDPGFPRSTSPYPICPAAIPNDNVIFEHATDPSIKYWLPRYRLRQSGGVYEIAIAEDSGSWKMSFGLETFPAPEIEEASRTSQPLPHVLKIAVNYGSIIVRSIDASEAIADGAGLVAAFRMALEERDALLRAFQSDAANATLAISRGIEVAVPAAERMAASPQMVLMMMRGDALAVEAVPQTFVQPEIFHEIRRPPGEQPDPRTDIAATVVNTETVTQPAVDAGEVAEAAVVDPEAVAQPSLDTALIAELGVDKQIAEFGIDRLPEAVMNRIGLDRVMARPQLRVDRDVLMGMRSISDQVVDELPIIDMLELSPQARWQGAQLTDSSGNSRDGVDLVFNGNDGDASGFVILSPSIALEDGTTRRALRTHPKWVAFGTIKGWHPAVRLPASAKFLAKVGFVRGAVHTDGVEFIVFAHYDLDDGRRTWVEVLRHHKSYTESLDEVSVDLSHLSGRDVGLELRVDAGESSGQDWAAWIDPCIVGVPPEPSAPVEPRFVPAALSLDIPIALRFDPAVHPYLFNLGLGGAHQAPFERILVRFPFDDPNGITYAYFQDTTRPNKFHYLANEFLLARTDEPPYIPALQFRFKGDATDQSKMEMACYIRPYTDSKRLLAARDVLVGRIPERSGIEKTPILQPIVAPAKLRFQLPQGTVDSSAQVDLANGFWVTQDISLNEFKDIFAIMASAPDSSALMRGTITVSTGLSADDQIPVELRLRRLVGEMFASTEIWDEATRSMALTLRNATESKLRIVALSVWLRRGQQLVDGQLEGLDLSNPVELAPDAVLKATVRSPQPLGGSSPVDAVMDLAGITPVVDPEVALGLVLDEKVALHSERSILVMTTDAALSGGTEPDKMIETIVVEFAGNVQAVLDADHTKVDVAVPVPLIDVLLGRDTGGTYQFRQTVVYASQPASEEGWRTSNRGVLVVPAK